MVFNPFTSFRKYQKFWMATVLLLCMVTFVLCTGVGGDLSDRLINLFRSEGQPLLTVNGRRVYAKELNAVKEQRNIANDFMKRACDEAIKNLMVRIADPKMPEQERKQLQPFLAAAKADLEQRRVKPRYFGTGVKIEDLMDFMVWQTEADQLGVNLLPDDVANMLVKELHGELSRFSGEQMHAIIRDMRPIMRTPTQALIIKALRDEYRARIAQNALEYADWNNINRKMLKVKFFSQLNPEVRVALSPGMLWDSFKANRSTFDVSLVPVEVEAFMKDVPQPTEPELRSLFISHQKDRYDPTAPMPGFEIPPSTRVEYVMGDPTSPKFKQWSHAAILLEATPPAWAPGSPLSMLVRYVGGPLAQREVLQAQYGKLQREANARGPYLSAGWNQPLVSEALAVKLASPYPEAAVSWIAGGAQPSNFATAPLGFMAFGPIRQPEKMSKGLAAELKERAAPYATIVSAGGTGLPFQTLALFSALTKDKFFALDVVTEQVTEYLERRQAETWVNQNMIALRKQLDDPVNVGRRANFTRVLDRNVDKMGLELRATKEFYNRFNISKAPELQPLVKAYDAVYSAINQIEKRDLTPELALKEDDFYRLFFDSTESFSVAGSTYKAKPWPPRVIIKGGQLAGSAFLSPGEDPNKPTPLELFDRAEKPILFWKIEDRPGKMPEDIAQVHDRVEKAWKFLKARETLALPRAKEIADSLQKSEEGFGPVLQIYELKSGKPIINLKGLAKMYTNMPPQPALPNLPRAFQAGERDYSTYQVPKDLFTYPRDDMAAELLSLHDLKKPIEIGAPKLDEFNRALFEAGAKSRRFVQILTNKPRSAFYVACVTFNPGPSMAEFRSVLKYAFPSEAFQGGRYMDYFFDRAFNEAGTTYQQTLMDQLREQTNSSIVAEPKERESFNANEAT